MLFALYIKGPLSTAAKALEAHGITNIKEAFLTASNESCIKAEADRAKVMEWFTSADDTTLLWYKELR